jgi:outer membrane protein OmpA-like peptidoglycan-associated protein
MMFRKILLLVGIFLTSLILLVSSSAAFADDDRQVWRDSEGQIVHDTWGMCVRSRWALDYDSCAPPPEQITWQPTQHTVIAQEDRTVYFGFNRADLTEEAKKKLGTLANRIKSAKDIQAAQVAGYADRIGTVSYNELLSKKRAANVRDYLVAHDIVNASVTNTRWYGKSEPSANCSNNLPRTQLIECLQPDRKVQVDITYKSEAQ